MSSSRRDRILSAASVVDLVASQVLRAFRISLGKADSRDRIRLVTFLRSLRNSSAAPKVEGKEAARSRPVSVDVILYYQSK